MNPALDPAIIAAAFAENESSAAAEYGAEFRSDIEAFITRETVDRVTIPGRAELPPAEGIAYRAFVDPSGGSSDSFTLAVAHRERDAGVLDVLREVRPPFSPESVVREFAELLGSYGISRVEGDHYAGLWPRERFAVHGISYTTSERSRSDIYSELLPLLNGGRVELLDNPRLHNQLTGLERRTSRAGKDSIDHSPGQHDDLANAAAGALVLVAGKADRLALWRKLGGFDEAEEPNPAPALAIQAGFYSRNP